MSSKKKYAFIINPSKKNYKDIEWQIKQYFSLSKLSKPKFFYTTLQSRGRQQAQIAIENGFDVIVACGGDGTVRSVACGMANSGKSMGVVPIGTANLFARNADIPVGNITQALRTITKNKVEKIDLGFVIRDEEPEHKHAFTVIAGIGWDAEVIAKTNEKAKSYFGFLAYFISMLKNIFQKRIKIDFVAGNSVSKSTQIAKSGLEIRSLLVGNYSKIPGFTLLPNAVYDDGLLDVAIVNTKGGLFGWFQLLLDITLQRFGVESLTNASNERLNKFQITNLQIKLQDEAFLQLDGDIIDKTKGLTVEVAPKALNILNNS